MKHVLYDTRKIWKVFFQGNIYGYVLHLNEISWVHGWIGGSQLVKYFYWFISCFRSFGSVWEVFILLIIFDSSLIPKEVFIFPIQNWNQCKFWILPVSIFSMLLMFDNFDKFYNILFLIFYFIYFQFSACLPSRCLIDIVFH